ncbi:uncharacterized protein V1516DRAFT_307417 [Lipomyces oligophaga]|uniref:uncharacterized protein n=1 Tax=Lipomyces oligophaga TaxID=45792 RepID=UPI0034CFDB8E
MTAARAISRKPSSVAILGGGISGLSAAYYVSRLLPKETKITIFESKNRLGGFIESERFRLPEQCQNGDGKDSVLFEYGPRTLRVSKRVSSLNAFDLINKLGMKDELIVIAKDSAAARNRYVYHQGRINMIPYSLTSILKFYFSQPLFRGMLPEVIREPFRLRGPSSEAIAKDDESIGSFMTRRFGPRITDRLLSGVIHGIYAGDIYQLSVKSILEYLWKREKTEGSIVPLWRGRGRQAGMEEVSAYRKEYAERNRRNAEEITGTNEELLENLKGASVISFKHGMESFVSRLTEQLSESNVDIQKGRSVRHIEPISESQGESKITKVKLTLDDGTEQIYDQVISALPARKLEKLVRGDRESVELAEGLGSIPSVSVGVVNLFYNKPNLLPVTGFGYLLPQTVPLADNPDRALGVVFDSDTVASGDDCLGPSQQNDAAGTKVTVMLGGHWWGGKKPGDVNMPSGPDEAADKAKQLIRRQLGVQEQPVVVHAMLQQNCIPQYVVGHTATLGRVHEAVLSAFDGALALVGASYLGVSVNDCIYYARLAAEDIAAGRRVSGLEAKL